MRFKVNDKVIVIAGKHKGKTGKILKIDRKKNKIIVEKVNLQIGYRKKTERAPGQKIEKEAPLDASNVMMIDPQKNIPTRIGYRRLKSGKKERYAKKSGVALS